MDLLVKKGSIVIIHIDEKYKNAVVKVPNSVVIGTLEFDRFVNDNNLYRFFKNEERSDGEISREFLKCEILRNTFQDPMYRALGHYEYKNQKASRIV